MAKINFYTTDNAEKEAVFNAIAADKGMTPFAVEKDWWVSRTLEIIFQMNIAKHNNATFRIYETSCSDRSELQVIERAIYR